MADESVAVNDKGLSHYVRPVITLLLSLTFCSLVVLTALGKVTDGFEKTTTCMTFFTMFTTAYALWFGERSALKVPGEKKANGVTP
jgi:hypothetical protein